MSYLWRKFPGMSRVVGCFFLFPLLFGACSPNNVTVDDSLGRYFDSAGVKGAFGLFDNGHGHFTIYNLSRFSDSLYSPGATFDILQSLIAIQTGIRKDDSALSETQIQENRSLGIPVNFGQEFRDTQVFNKLAFITLSMELERDTLKKWIDSLQYGNRKTGDSLDFWLDDALKINCDEQLGLLKRLYFNQLPFFERTQTIVRRMMSSESNSMYRFCYKTAMVRGGDGHAVGWAMGWVEENKHPYFFVVNVESTGTAKDLRKTGLDIAKKILAQEGFFKGNK
jgi:beta-lactamase class D